MYIHMYGHSYRLVYVIANLLHLQYQLSSYICVLYTATWLPLATVLLQIS